MEITQFLSLLRLRIFQSYDKYFLREIKKSKHDHALWYTVRW